MKLNREEKRKIVINDFETGRLEMLLELSKTLKNQSFQVRESNKEKLALVSIAVELGLLYQNDINIDVSTLYDDIQQIIIKVFELEEMYNELG